MSDILTLLILVKFIINLFAGSIKNPQNKILWIFYVYSVLQSCLFYAAEKVA